MCQGWGLSLYRAAQPACAPNKGLSFASVFSCKAHEELSFLLRELKTLFTFSLFSPDGKCRRHIPASGCSLPGGSGNMGERLSRRGFLGIG